MSSASRSPSHVSARDVLSFADVRARMGDLRRRPKIPGAATLGPHRDAGRHQSRRPQSTGGVRFELTQHHVRRCAVICYDHVDMIAPNRVFLQLPVADVAVVLDNRGHIHLRISVQDDGRMTHSRLDVPEAGRAGCQHRRSVRIVLPIDRAARVAVEPRAVRSPGQEKTCRLVHGRQWYRPAWVGASRWLAGRLLARRVLDSRSLALRVLIRGPYG